MARASEISPDLEVLNGLRALASVWVVLYHCYTMFILAANPDPLELRNSWFFRFSAQGSWGVDVFLTLTSMLASYQLIPMLKAARLSPLSVIRQYYAKRARRLLPAYLVANLVIMPLMAAAHHALSLGHLSEEAQTFFLFNFRGCPQNLWANICFLTHNLGWQSCGGHFWSFTLQFQFFMAFPLLLYLLQPQSAGFKARLGIAFSLAAALGTLWRVLLASWTPFRFPFSNSEEDIARMFKLTEAVYFSNGGRLAQLAIGAILGLVLRSPTIIKSILNRHISVSSCLHFLQVFCMSLAWRQNITRLPHEDGMGQTASALYVALAWYGSPLVSITLAGTLIAIAFKLDPIHKIFGIVLKKLWLDRLGNLSFSLYLLHMQCMFAMAIFCKPIYYLSTLGLPHFVQFAAFASASLIASYAAAYVLHFLIERRF